MVYLIKCSNGESHDMRSEWVICYFTTKEQAEKFLECAEEYREAFTVWINNQNEFHRQYPQYTQHGPAPTRPDKPLTATFGSEDWADYFRKQTEWQKREQECFASYNKAKNDLMMELGIHSSQAPLNVGYECEIEKVECGLGFLDMHRDELEKRGMVN